MNLYMSLLWASCLTSTVFSRKSPFNHGVIIEYEDWAPEDNNALLEDVKNNIGSKAQVDEVEIKPHVEISSSVFRGVSANVTGLGSDVTEELVQSTIQNLRVVKKVSPIILYYPASTIASSGPLQARGEMLSMEPRAAAMQEETGSFSVHKMTGVDKVHAEGVKGKGITIAIMDSGFDYKQDSLGNTIGPGSKAIYGYDWVGDDYQFGGTPVEDDDPWTECTIHGTHVFGIAGANPTRFGVSGSAPEASFELHRVFGCLGAVASDILIKATTAIYERGVDVITASISVGSGSQYPSDPWSTVVQRINQNGTYFMGSAGNSGSSYYSGVAPASGIDVTAVGAVVNTETPNYYWNGSYTSGGVTNTNLTWIPGSRVAFPEEFSLWTASSELTDPLNSACAYPPDLELPNFNTTVLLVNWGYDASLICSGSDATKYLASLGAKYILFYIAGEGTPSRNPLTLEVASPRTASIEAVGVLSATSGEELFSALQKDPSLKASLGSPSNHKDSLEVTPNGVSGGRMADWSSWGPTNDGRTFPTFSAPGASFLSTLPKRLGGFGVLSGSEYLSSAFSPFDALSGCYGAAHSMSTPYAAGVVGLVKQAHPDWDALTIRNVLATTSRPMQYNDNTSTVYDFLAPVFQQGGGLIDAYRAVRTATVVDVPGLSFNDTAHQPKSLSFKVKNIGTTAQTYKLSHIGAASGLGLSSRDSYTLLDDSGREVSRSLQATYAEVEITPLEVTIPPGQESTITVSITKVPDLDITRLPFYGGYIALNSTDSINSVTVPYTGIATSLYDTPIDTSGTTLAFYNATSDNATALTASTTFNVTFLGVGVQWPNNTIWPAIIPDVKSALVYYAYKYDLLKANGDLFFQLWMFEDLNVQPGFNFYLDGTDPFIPPGDYRLSVSVLKIYGNMSKEEDWVSSSTLPFTLNYNPESVSFPTNATNATTATNSPITTSL
ncbi:uncharacterized protein L3040_000088 [Drepanopeziza brunnea f. sp. 'multigermtubi']|uniref:uncharacterized protein n=1 Tax=Drepanopeziza brunnea f. sp. 'multigermtubi' TaxID=698441 RepID=UPI0023953812|nr:hypothetical protein L3040_000088 [Drepanopeziza brunnea f. sp. 'multigermtubi']